VETVVTTWTLCTIADPGRALGEFQRVLRPDGRLLFVEHGRSPDPEIVQWQDRMTPIWRRLAGGCHLNRPIDRLVEASGFAIEGLWGVAISAAPVSAPICIAESRNRVERERTRRSLTRVEQNSQGDTHRTCEASGANFMPPSPRVNVAADRALER
jgi:SAM-dependent methyltransferase